ncbi:MAG: hypothetical protein VZR54_08930 [Ruminococcus sp.]|nr:hypothetical protein [Ruminococcus sp.]
MNTINIKALSEQVSKLSASGSSLPDVTTADNGKVLGVVEGSWNKIDAPSGGVDYSTTEQNTGIKWIDGKDIYQKTYVFENTSISPQNPVKIADISGVDHVVLFKGSITESDTIYAIPDISLRCFIENNELKLGCPLNTSWISANGSVTILYTKPTETKTKRKTTK